MYTYQIEVGDWSGDGHDKRETIVIKTNLDAKEINNAYNKTSSATKISLLNEVKRTVLFDNYEDNVMSKEIFDKLKSYGVNLDILLDKYDVYEEEDKYFFNPKSASVLYMEMAKTNLPDLKYTILDKKEEILVKGLGYGLFY